MKKSYIGFYEPSKSEITNTWKDGIFSFDANALLNLYRYSEKTSQDFINVLKKLQERIWIPFQSGYEFHNNRLTVIEGQENAYNEIILILDKLLAQTEKEIGTYKKHCLIDTRSYISEITTCFNHIKEDLELLIKNHPDFSKTDVILEQITKLLTGKIGKGFSLDELQLLYKEGLKRYENKIPPGYIDANDKKKREGGDRHVYGDLIIWKELIREFSKKPRPLIFVTDDRKEDWWSKHNGKTYRPREELIKEFYDSTGIRILIYQTDVFLEYAKKQIDKSIGNDTIKEIKETRINDELFIKQLVHPQGAIGGSFDFPGSMVAGAPTGYYSPGSLVTGAQGAVYYSPGSLVTGAQGMTGVIPISDGVKGISFIIPHSTSKISNSDLPTSIDIKKSDDENSLEKGH